MYSGIQTFGESLTAWMEENNLTPSALSAYTRETRDATIARLMHDQLDYQRCARYITELSESYPDISEDVLKRLRIAVDVNRYGKDMYLAKQNFFRMITGGESVESVEYSRSGCFCDELLAWSEGMSFQLLCMGLTDIEPQRLLNFICTKRKNVRIYNFFDRNHAEELSGLLAETLPFAFNPNYELFEINDKQGTMMGNSMIARREDGAHLLIVYDGGEYYSLPVSKGTDFFNFCLSILLSRSHMPKKINCRFTRNIPAAYLDFLSECLLLEKNKAIYHIKSEVGLEYVPVDLLYENFCEWAAENDLRFLPFSEKLKEVFEERYRNIMCKTEPTYLIMTKNGMTEFAKTGRMKDHPFCLRPFSPEERRRIFRNLLEAASNSSSFNPLIFTADHMTINHAFIGYSEECVLVCAAQADYDLSNYTEIVLNSRELSGRFSDFVTGILAKSHVLSKKAGLEFIQSLISIVPSDE